MAESEDNLMDKFTKYTPSELKQIIDSHEDSSRRIRIIISVLVIAGCIAISLLWNSLSFSWKHQRVKSMRDYISCIYMKEDYQTRYVKLKKEINNHSISFNKCIKEIITKDSLNKNYPNNTIDSLFKSYHNILIDSLKNIERKKDSLCRIFECKEDRLKFFKEYFGGDVIGRKDMHYLYMLYWLIQSEHIKSFKIPLFDVSFDINDLGIIGGLGFSIILFIFYLSLKREKENLTIAFKAFEITYGNDFKKRDNYYFILSMNQVLTIPYAMKHNSTRLLRSLIRALLCLPVLFEISVLMVDLLTRNIGFNISENLTLFGYVTTGFYVFIMLTITMYCIRNLDRIDNLWKKEKEIIRIGLEKK